MYTHIYTLCNIHVQIVVVPDSLRFNSIHVGDEGTDDNEDALLHDAVAASLLFVPSQVKIYVSELKERYQTEKLPTYLKHPKQFKLKPKEYIKLALVHKDQGCEKETASLSLLRMLRGKVEEECKMRTPLSMEEIGHLPDGSILRRILVEGPPGIGKTTFAWELCRLWAVGEILQQYTLVVMLQLSMPMVKEAKTLQDIFNYPIDDDVSHAVTNFVRQNLGEKVMFVLEGFDELAHNLKQGSFLDSLLSKTVLSRATLLVTTRPAGMAKLHANFIPNVDQHIKILGFTDEHIQSYLISACQDQPQLLKDLKSYLSSQPFVQSVMYNPLECAIVAEVYAGCWHREERGFAPKSLTELYSSLLQAMIVRYISEHPSFSQKQLKIRTLSDIPEEVYGRLMQLALLAAEGITKRQYTFEEVPCDTMGLMQQVDESDVQQYNACLYSFLHLTVQEYLAAFYWSKQEISTVTTLITDTTLFPVQTLVEKGIHHDAGSNIHHWPVLLFISGLTRFEVLPVEYFTSALASLAHSDETLRSSASLCQMVYEAQNPNIASSLFANDCFQPLCITPLDWYSLGYCIAHSNPNSSWCIAYTLWTKPDDFRVLVTALNHFATTDKERGKISILLLECQNKEILTFLKMLPEFLLCHCSEIKCLVFNNASVSQQEMDCFIKALKCCHLKLDMIVVCFKYIDDKQTVDLSGWTKLIKTFDPRPEMMLSFANESIVSACITSWNQDIDNHVKNVSKLYVDLIADFDNIMQGLELQTPFLASTSLQELYDHLAFIHSIGINLSTVFVVPDSEEWKSVSDCSQMILQAFLRYCANICTLLFEGNMDETFCTLVSNTIKNLKSLRVVFISSGNDAMILQKDEACIWKGKLAQLQSHPDVCIVHDSSILYVLQHFPHSIQPFTCKELEIENCSFAGQESYQVLQQIPSLFPCLEFLSIGTTNGWIPCLPSLTTVASLCPATIITAKKTNSCFPVLMLDPKRSLLADTGLTSSHLLSVPQPHTISFTNNFVTISEWLVEVCVNVLIRLYFMNCTVSKCNMDILSYCCTLQLLVLDRCTVSQDDLHLLVLFVKGNHNLRELLLRQCSIGTLGALIVAVELVQGEGTIAEVGVLDSSIGNEGAVALIEALSDSTILVLRLLPQHAQCLDLTEHSFLAGRILPVNLDDPNNKAHWIVL